MVSVAANAIQNHPKQITFIAPLMSFLFCLGAGTGNIVYPLLPVIYDVSYGQGIRPSRPLSLTVVISGVALACSPVSAAMAAMITLTDVPPYNFDLIKILSITIPAAVIGLFLTSLVVSRMGPDLEDDPEYQARIADGRLQAAVGQGSGEKIEIAVHQGRPQRRLHLPRRCGVIVDLRSVPRPAAARSRPTPAATPISVTVIIQMVMMVAGGRHHAGLEARHEEGPRLDRVQGRHRSRPSPCSASPG